MDTILPKLYEGRESSRVSDGHGSISLNMTKQNIMSYHKHSNSLTQAVSFNSNFNNGMWTLLDTKLLFRSEFFLGVTNLNLEFKMLNNRLDLTCLDQVIGVKCD